MCLEYNKTTHPIFLGPVESHVVFNSIRYTTHVKFPTILIIQLDDIRLMLCDVMIKVFFDQIKVHAVECADVMAYLF